MKLNKKYSSFIAVASIIAIVYTIIYWILPIDFSASKLIAFIFTIISIVICLYSFYLAYKSEDIKSKVYGFPISRVGAIYCGIQLVISLLILFISIFIVVPYWLTVILCAVLLGAGLVGIIITDNTRDIVEAQDKKNIVQTREIKYFRVNIQNIIDICKNENVKKELIKLGDIFQYSDPVSSDATSQIETEIKEMIDELLLEINDKSEAINLEKIECIKNSMNNRNRLCKVAKGN